MADYPLLGGQRYLVSSVPASSTGIGITPNATAHTKGSYTALQTAAGNTTGAQGVLLTVRAITPNVDYLLDFAAGAAASEQVIASNLLISPGSMSEISTYWLPISIASGIRIAARCQCSGTSAGSLSVVAHLMTQGFLPSQPAGRIVSYGLNTGTTRGTSVDPGGTINTEGSWTEITSSTTQAHSNLIVAVGNQQNVARDSASYLVDIGVGGSGSEVEVFGDLFVYAVAVAATAYDHKPKVFPPLPLQIPEGTRLSARMRSDINDATDRTLDVALYGIG